MCLTHICSIATWTSLVEQQPKTRYWNELKVPFPFLFFTYSYLIYLLKIYDRQTLLA